jgi:hypothetical protein
MSTAAQPLFEFNHHNPTRICFGTDSFAHRARLIPATARVLMLYSGGAAGDEYAGDARQTHAGYRRRTERKTPPAHRRAGAFLRPVGMPELSPPAS